MDITTDGFGFMLSFGDLTWLPFTYGLQARYLAFHPVHLGLFWSAVIIAIKLTGLYIFRVSNNEKGDFRNGKNPKSEYPTSDSNHTQSQSDSILISRLDFHADREGHQAPDLGMVGTISTPCKWSLTCSISNPSWTCDIRADRQNYFGDWLMA
jgi:hypothetical protein